MKLTTRTIDTAKADPAKDLYLRDGDGLELRILRGTGKKLWQLRYTFAGKRKVLRLGDYSTCSLRDARLLAMDAKKTLSLGNEPSAQNKASTSATLSTNVAQPTVSMTPSMPMAGDTAASSSYRLVDLMEAYVQLKQNNGQLAYAHDVEKSIRLYVVQDAPDIANMSAKLCTPEDMAALIRPIHARGKTRAADKLRSMLSAAFRAAMQAPYHPGLPQEMIGFEITSNPVLALPAIPGNARERFLTQAELGQFGAELLANSGNACSCIALSLLTGGQRPLQLSRITNADYDDQEGILLLRDPKGKRHTARPHYLPVGPIARAYIEKLQTTPRAIQHPIWFSVDGIKSMSATTLSHQCLRLQKQLQMEPFQLRDVRRTVETEMARIGFSKDIRAHLLSHGLSGVQERHYDRYDRIHEKREALVLWENHLMALIAPYQ